MNKASVDLRVWRQFVVLAEELHFGRAAQRLHMTQPPLTQAMAQLERALGVLLFDRTRRRVALTPAGAALLPEAQELLARAQRLPELARAAAAGEVGRLRVAFVSTVGFELLPAWVRGFRLHAPQIALELVEATGDVQLQALERGDIDAGVVLHSPAFAPSGHESLVVGTEPLVLALPSTHALAQMAHPPLADVLAEPLVLFPRRILPSIHDALFALYHGAGQPPVVVQEAIQMQTIVNLVAAGLGVAWVPQSVSLFQRSGVVYRSPAWPHAARTRAAAPLCETRLIWSAQRNSPAVARFVSFVRAGAGGRLAQSPSC